MIVWTEYLKYKAHLHGFELSLIEQVVRFSEERYFDTITQRLIAVGRHGNRLIVVPYEKEDDTVTPVTVHATTRQQITFRLRTGRYRL
jgi:hypothetical protein